MSILLHLEGIEMLKYEPDIMGSYNQNDVTFLLRDISHLNIEASSEEREEKIQKGMAHYSEMLPVEYQPNKQYMMFYESMLLKYAHKIAYCVAVVCEKLLKIRNSENIILVSLARAGTPIGILMKKYLKLAYNTDVVHYSISIIRGRGIDQAALQYITAKHPQGEIQFIDGWTGKGAITQELKQAVAEWNANETVQLDAQLAVLADPGHCVKLYGTREDFLIPSACLNSTVSGLVSRTVFNEKFLSRDDFHGAKYYRELANVDVSNEFIETIAIYFTDKLAQEAKSEVWDLTSEPEPTWQGEKCVAQIQQHYNIQNRHHVKPGVGETTRVLLRRVPWKILVNPTAGEDLTHIYMLAQEHGIEVEHYSNMPYSCCGLIKELL